MPTYDLKFRAYVPAGWSARQLTATFEAFCQAHGITPIAGMATEVVDEEYVWGIAPSEYHRTHDMVSQTPDESTARGGMSISRDSSWMLVRRKRGGGPWEIVEKNGQ